MKKSHFLAIPFAALACLPLVAATVAEEPECASVALLFDRAAIEQGCLDGDIVIVFGGPSEGNSSGKSLSSDEAFGEFASSNLNLVSAQYVTQGGVRDRVVHQIGDLVSPQQGVMLLGPGGDFQIEFCGFVSDNSNTLEPDELGTLGLVIVTGLVH